MKKQKGFAKILLVIVAIIAVAVFIYIRMGYRTETIPSNVTDNKASSSLQSSEKNITADWKTYRNDKYGFEVKYPDNWSIDERSKTDEYIAVILSKDGINRFDLYVHDPIIDANGKKVMLNEYLSSYSYDSNELREEKSIGGIQMLYFEDKTNKEYEKKSFRYIIPAREDLMYEFILNSTDYNDIVSFDKILSTFKFTK